MDRDTAERIARAVCPFKVAKCETICDRCKRIADDVAPVVEAERERAWKDGWDHCYDGTGD